MKNKTVFQRMTGIALAAALIMGYGQPVTAAPEQESEFPAAFEHGESSYIVNGNFDGEDNFVTSGNTYDSWFTFNSQKDTSTYYSATASLKIAGSGTAVDQRVELKPDTAYELSAWINAEVGQGARLRAFLNGGADPEDKKLKDTDEKCYGTWYQYINEFTTDADTTFADIGVVRAHASLATDGAVWVDDITIREAGAPESAERTDAGTIRVKYPDDRTEAPAADDVTLLYGIGGQEPTTELECQMTWDEASHTATVTHANIAEGSSTEASFYLEIQGETFTQNVNLPANPDFVSPVLSEVKELTNGSAVLVLEKAASRELTQGEISIMYTDYDGQPATASVTGLEKKSDTEYAVEFGKIAPREEDKEYMLTFQIGESTATATMTVTTTKGKTFYLDATNGNDSNDGLTPETAWKTLDKANDTVFMPGSSLLLKAGETWTGTLAPQGSGEEGAPIVLSSYGEGDRPRILLDENAVYSETIMRVAAAKIRDVNETFRLHNQEWWEISNIEFHDAGYSVDHEANQFLNGGGLLERAMYITAEDVGQLDHIYIDNVYIHGFQTGDSGNTGKESGGIIFLISANIDDASKRKETWFNDISVTNCTIEDVGRSGFFLLSPWKTREMTEDGKWGGRWAMVNNAGEGSLGEFSPTTNVYFGKNIFRRIHGDGIILQCMDGAVAEYNLVDETCMGHWFAAGIFPYLVTDGTVQYNELCRTHRGNDAEGVEIDALNEDFAVVYNYSHENSGGFVQFCAYGNLPTYDSYYAYNISENDGSYGSSTNSVIMPLNATINCEVFNNTVCIDPDKAVENYGADRFFNINNSNNQSVAIYNNIFYRAGETYKFNANEVNYFNSMQALADDNSLNPGDLGRFANNLFYNFSTEGIDTESTFYQDNIWGEDPLLKAPGTMGDGDVDALVKEKNITKAWNLEAYMLSEGSPAIDAGRAISTEYSGLDDMLGNPVDSQNPDLGAIQYIEAVDKEELQFAYDLAVQMDLSIYTDDTKKAVEEAIAEAKAVLENENALQEEIDSALEKLNTAVDNLELIPVDKTKLEELIKDSESLDLSIYTEETANALTQSLQAAKAVLSDDNATEEDVAKAEAELKDALNALKEKDEQTDKKPGSDDKKPSDVNKDNNNKNNDNKNAGDDKIVETGDDTPIASTLLIIVLAGGVIAAVIAYRRGNRRTK
jgi:hypothetical protein